MFVSLLKLIYVQKSYIIALNIIIGNKKKYFGGLTIENIRHSTARIRDQKGNKNLISNRLKALRLARRLSQRALAEKLQVMGYDMDKNVIMRIETNRRFVSDIELKAFCLFFKVTYNYLIDGIQEEKDTNSQKN